MTWLRGLCFGLALLGCNPELSTGVVSVGPAAGDDGDGGPREMFDPRRPRGSSSVGAQTASEGSGDGGLSGEPCDRDDECRIGKECFQGTCVGDGALRFSLSWEAETDYDLHVVTPNDIEIYYSNPADDGALLDVDDCVGSFCRVPGGTHIENIYFSEDPPRGTYRYWVHNYDGDVAARFELIVSAEGMPDESETGTAPVGSPGESTHYTFVY